MHFLLLHYANRNEPILVNSTHLVCVSAANDQSVIVLQSGESVECVPVSESFEALCRVLNAVRVPAAAPDDNTVIPCDARGTPV